MPRWLRAHLCPSSLRLAVKMQTTDLYVDQSDPTSAVPVFSHTVLTPFGEAPIGFSNQTWSNIKKGPPDAS